MKQTFTKLFAALALLAFLAVPMGMWGQTRDTKTDIMFAKGFAGYTTGSFSAAGTDRTAVANSTNATGVTYAMQVFNGSTGAVRGNQSGAANYSCRNTTTYDGYYISSVSLTITSSGGGTLDGGTNGRSIVYFGSTAYANPNTTAPSGTSTVASPNQSGQTTLTWTNTDETVSYFILYNLKTSGTVLSESSSSPLTVVWTKKTGPSIPSTTLTIDDTNLTNTDVYTNTEAGWLSATVKAGTETISNPSISWVSSNEDVATIDEDGVVTLVAAGTVTITASYAGEPNVYGPSSNEYTLVVEDSTPFAGGVVTFVAGTDTGTSTGQNEDQMTKSGVTVHSTKAALATSEYRLYQNSITTISTTTGTITEIVFTGNSTTYPVSRLSVDNDNGTYTTDNNVGTWTGDASSVSFSASAQARASQIAVTVVVSSAVATTTTINVPANFNTDIYQGTNAGTLTATVKDNENNVISGATVTWSSSDTDVATIDASTGVVTLVAIGTTTITASYAGVEDQYRLSQDTYTLEVTSSAPQVDYATLPFVWQGGSSSAFLALNGVTANGLGGDYASGNAPYLIKLDGTGDYIQVKTDSKPGTVTIDVKMIGGSSTSNITIQGSADGETFTDVEVLTISGAQNDELTLETTNAFAANDRYVRMLFTKGSNVGVGPITIAKPAYTLTIEGYGTGTGNWYLIASPINVSIDPVSAGMITDDFVSTTVTPENGTYDLYRFNQSADLEWENYRVNSFALESGKGYLYANKNDVSIQFAGTPYNSNGVIPLVYVEGKEFAGWNLVGNPFTTASTISLPYYKMNDGHTALTSKTEGGTIAAMEGVFVYAYDETSQQAISSVTFTASRSRGNSNASVNIDVMHNGANIDNAIVRFDEGRQLPKYQLFENSTKLYISKNGKDYAIVSSEAQGEMPVNFKAEENGTYTLDINTENVEMNYLHLIDNMTGMDVDLLQTPSYTFDANTNDYTSRFRLVFSANNEDGPSTGSEAFAFYSNGNWVIGNEGEATLQVIDVNGRIVSNETINGTVATSINATPGVYMLRLVNGNEVKTQKIVVR